MVSKSGSMSVEEFNIETYTEEFRSPQLQFTAPSFTILIAAKKNNVGFTNNVLNTFSQIYILEHFR